MSQEDAREPASLRDGRKKHRTLKTTTHRALLGAFARLRRVTIRFAMFVSLPARMEQLGFHWTDFLEI